ncbi:hypothetical protein [Bradyrhizobium liaoningense]|uniref:hypothetical protein n=1 Tax=Bradyrhizobium liaoningense TaxID=43992 RepID=UPI001BACB1CB|nr:hypothetical protein [Bradyrhizobium liaoningense]MBR0904597.1 hypothetical protein [Bradyrhizobium liaoningense]
MASTRGYIVISEERVDDLAPRRFAVLAENPMAAILEVLDVFPDMHCRVLRPLEEEESKELLLRPGKIRAYDN